MSHITLAASDFIYTAEFFYLQKQSKRKAGRRRELNARPAHYEGVALPVELFRRSKLKKPLFMSGFFGWGAGSQNIAENPVLEGEL